MKKRTGIAGLIACLIGCCTGTALAAAADREWYTLKLGGQRMGYAWHETRTTADERIDSQVTRVYVSQMQRATLIENTIEVSRTKSGVPRSIHVLAKNGANRSGWNASFIEPRSLLLTVLDSRGTRKLTLPPDLLLPDQLSDALARFAAGTDKRVALPLLDTSSASIVQAEAERIDAATRDGTRIRLTIPVAGSAPRTETFWFKGARLMQRERTLFSLPLQFEPCDHDCNASVGKPYDVMARLIVSSPYRVPDAAMKGPIRYVIARADGTTPRLPVTGEQAVMLDGARSVVTVCDRCGEAAKLGDAERRSYLAANSWVQSDAEEVRRFAFSGGRGGKPERVMPELVEAVRAHMTGETNVLGYASATQALSARSGDCTEFAVLLAAAARARGIPARLVVGLVYAERFSGKKEVFSPHMWVQAWTGDRWVSYDAGIGKFDATHIALGIGDGDPRRMDVNYGASGQWRIEKLGLVKTP